MVIANNLTLHYKKQFKGDSPAIFEPEDLSAKREGMTNLDHEKRSFFQYLISLLR